MSKCINRTVEVMADDAGRPTRMRWRRRHIAVDEILDGWEEAGCWWHGEQARRVYCVRCAGSEVYELHHQPPGGWRLFRAYD